MNNQFDELTKNLAQSVTRRAALKKFGVGLAGMALACFGLANKAAAGPGCESCVKYCVSSYGYSAKYCRETICSPVCNGNKFPQP